LPTVVASLLAKVTAVEPPSPTVHMDVGEAFPTGLRSCWRRALSHHLKRQWFFPNRNSETLLHWESLRQQGWSLRQQHVVLREIN
jgi:hypothetical protein